MLENNHTQYEELADREIGLESRIASVGDVERQRALQGAA